LQLDVGLPKSRHRTGVGMTASQVLLNDVLATLWPLTALLGIAAAVVALRGRRLWRGLAVLFACAVLFQVHTFAQPSPILGAILLGALIAALVPFKGITSESARSDRQAWTHSWRARPALVVTSVASVVVYGLGDLVSGLLHDGYSYRDQWISELTAFGSPVRLLMVTAILVHGLLLVAFGVGIRRSADRRSLRWVGGLLILAGAIGFPTHTVFAMSSRWMTPGFNDTMHAILSLAFSLMMFAAVALSAVAYPGWFRLCSIATIPILVGFGAASSVAIQGIKQNSTLWAGGFERITAYTYFAWLIVLSVTATRRSLDHGRPHVRSGMHVSGDGDNRPATTERSVA